MSAVIAAVVFLLALAFLDWLTDPEAICRRRVARVRRAVDRVERVERVGR